MRKITVCLIAIMLLSIVTIPMAHEIKAETTDVNSSSSSVLTATIPLSSSEITSAWPNLPTARQLYNTVGVNMIDTRTLGMQGSLKNLDPNAPESLNLTSMVSNYTSNDVTIYGIVQNDPHIWLQYNSTVWVEVPTLYLNTTVQPFATAIKQLYGLSSLGPYPRNNTTSQTTSTSPDTSYPSTWAIGEYDNPSDICDGYPVMGALTYGEWSCYPPNTLPSGAEILTDVLTTYDDQNVGIQVMMCIINPGGGTEWAVAYNTWVDGVLTGGGTPLQPWSGHFTPSANTFYNEFIESTTGGNWNIYWDGYSIDTVSVNGDPSPHLQVGDAPHATLESNDFNLADFTSHQNYMDVIGGGQQTIGGQTVYEPAIGYYFDGVWAPTLPYETAPAGYVYVNPNLVGGHNVGSASLPNWSGSTPNELGYPDVLPIGLGQSGGSNTEGVQLWSLNPVP